MQTACILWVGLMGGHGYGRTRYLGIPVGAHRAAYAEEHGLNPLTMGGVVMHSCDNPPCVNPEHLSLGTHADNMRDMVQKGRASGTSHGYKYVLSDEDRADILSMRNAGYTVRHVASLYGISPHYVSHLCTGKKLLPNF